jgi:HTH-type transcriptional regulator, transcriptional repressor of NAD biosynthesis genes
MVRAFVFGKFLPFHVGHEGMIRFALQHCDFLSVLVCCSDQEGIHCGVRADWIRETFAGETRMEVVEYAYSEARLPNTSQSSMAVSEVWSKIFLKLFPDHDLLVTSEPYGKMVAEIMGIRHLPFDPDKTMYPISATKIREDAFRNWKYLPLNVRPYYSIKVAILGTESTGKTTLTRQLAEHFNCSHVLEAARDIIADSNTFTLADLYAVAEEHTRRIAQAMRGDCLLVILDTDIHITQSYAQYFFGRRLELDENVYATQSADLYLYLCNDVPHEQDGTRLERTERDALEGSHREILNQYGIPIVELHGDWEQRFIAAAEEIEGLLRKYCSITASGVED